MYQLWFIQLNYNSTKWFLINSIKNPGTPVHHRVSHITSGSVNGRCPFNIYNFKNFSNFDGSVWIKRFWCFESVPKWRHQFVVTIWECYIICQSINFRLLNQIFWSIYLIKFRLRRMLNQNVCQVYLWVFNNRSLNGDKFRTAF